MRTSSGQCVPVDADKRPGEGVGAPLGVRKRLQRMEPTDAQPLVGQGTERGDRDEPGEVGRHRYRARSVGQTLATSAIASSLTAIRSRSASGSGSSVGDQRAEAGCLRSGRGLR